MILLVGFLRSLFIHRETLILENLALLRLRTFWIEAVAAATPELQNVMRRSSSKSESGDRRVDVVEVQAFARLYRKPLGFFFDSPRS